MFLAMIVILVVTPLVGARLGRRKDKRSEAFSGIGFAMWAVAGLLSPVAVLSMVIGLLVLPVAAAVTFFAAYEHPDRSTVGFAAGVGLALVLFASLDQGRTTALVAGALLVAVAAGAGAWNGRRVLTH